MTTTVHPAPISKRIEVAATPERTFALFTGSMGLWWPKEHSVLFAMQGVAQADVRLEPRVGGRWFEVGVNGSEYDWGEVLAWEPPLRVLLAWRLDQTFAFNPQIHTEVEARITPGKDGGSVVELEHRGLESYGEAAHEMRESMDAGWSMILGRLIDRSGD